MKNIIFGSLLLGLIGIGLMGCEKEQFTNPNIKKLDRTSHVNNTETTARPTVVYANLSCQLENGEWGCQCIIDSEVSDCSMQTECTAQSTLKNYEEVLNAMFTQEEIQYRAINKVRIVEPELIDALKKDGFPLK